MIGMRYVTSAEELLVAYEAEIQSRGIPPIQEYRAARLSLMEGMFNRLRGPLQLHLSPGTPLAQP